MSQLMERNEIKIFNNEKFGQIRTVVLNGETWFVAKDVCDVLEILNPTDALNKGLEDFERARFNLGRQGEANIISESGFYTLVLRSRKPIAKPFRIWVTSEVLPSIRKTGMYKAETNNKVENMLSNMGMDLKVVYAQINNMENILDSQQEVLKTQAELFSKVMDNITLSTLQQGKIAEVARKRVNHLLGGAHSDEYKEWARTYMVNLWNNVKTTFKCGSSYKDLNPACFNEAIEYINNWDYIR